MLIIVSRSLNSANVASSRLPPVLMWMNLTTPSDQGGRCVMLWVLLVGVGACVSLFVCSILHACNEQGTFYVGNYRVCA